MIEKKKVYLVINGSGCARCSGFRSVVMKVFSSRKFAERFIKSFYPNAKSVGIEVMDVNGMVI